MFENLKKRFKAVEEKPLDYNEMSEDYVEINPEQIKGGPKQKVIVRPFIVGDFMDIKPALDAIKEKDLVELKRAVAKLKKTAEAIEGDIAGFGEDWIVVTPNFAQVHRESSEAGES